MADEENRSERVVEAYKRHKLARSALRRIHALIRGDEAGRAADRRLAGIGIVILLLLVAIALFVLSNGDRATLG